MTIYVKDILPIASPEKYKCHFARWNHRNQPLDVWVRSKADWQGWQEYRNINDRWKGTDFIFSLLKFYHQPDMWLFGGIFQILEKREDGYEVELMDYGSEFIGRLKIRSAYKERTSEVFFSNHYSEFEVKEILPEVYTGRVFPGFQNINLSFSELETLISNERPDWKAALGSVKGVYLITDTKKDKRYVGSAYGIGGVWQRWSCYMESGHGGNVGLQPLVVKQSLEYCREHFKFTLLEHRAVSTDDQLILERESHWKEILGTRGPSGYNKN